MITHITFSGGGIKGFCYLGILRYLYMEKMAGNIRYASGSSIGAYFAMVLGLKIPIDVLEEDFVVLLKEINDSAYLCIKRHNFINLFEKHGFHSPRFLLKPVIKYLKEKYDIEDITFMDFVKKTGVNLYVNATNLNTCERKVFSAENTPDISVLDAVVASMTVPFIFEGIQIDGEYYVDGVISSDMPLDLFENVNKNNVLAVLMMPSEKYAPLRYEKNTELSFMNYMSRLTYVIIANLTHQSCIKYQNTCPFYILKLTDLPYEGAFRFVAEEDNVRIDVQQIDIDNMILKGFIEMTNHMNERKKHQQLKV